MRLRNYTFTGYSMKCSTSLWSADLANLADIKRVDPYSDRYHLDVADGHYVGSLLFFPDLVKEPAVTQPKAFRGPPHCHEPTELD